MKPLKPSIHLPRSNYVDTFFSPLLMILRVYGSFVYSCDLTFSFLLCVYSVIVNFLFLKVWFLIYSGAILERNVLRSLITGGHWQLFYESFTIWWKIFIVYVYPKKYVQLISDVNSLINDCSLSGCFIKLRNKCFLIRFNLVLLTAILNYSLGEHLMIFEIFCVGGLSFFIYIVTEIYGHILICYKNILYQISDNFDLLNERDHFLIDNISYDCELNNIFNALSKIISFSKNINSKCNSILIFIHFHAFFKIVSGSRLLLLNMYQSFFWSEIIFYKYDILYNLVSTVFVMYFIYFCPSLLNRKVLRIFNYFFNSCY